ncbi:hypothetical protein Rhe02_28920 [Rhizocola hellebori]|uniref:SnoaL-like domain-containing protein n=1 Tax=Rhizocola hellebori TaxID=1392758 RepID=A0A8J3VFU0_9ACTN|nr:nuclear transport factor 2 family protein [Rhizocola hellebori]GIH04825.1 hypothetical protein Rhe02_28920 [Rhizocola hellebori]
MGRKQVAGWIAAYEKAWRTPGTQILKTIFTEDATYLQGPYHRPVVGLAAIARMWERERSGPDEVFTMTSELVAVDKEASVARIEVKYGSGEKFRDLWIIKLAPDGRCRSFEEWYIAPPKRTR